MGGWAKSMAEESNVSVHGGSLRVEKRPRERKGIFCRDVGPYIEIITLGGSTQSLG